VLKLIKTCISGFVRFYPNFKCQTVTRRCFYYSYKNKT